MASATNDTTNGVWSISQSAVSAAGTTSKITLNTAGTYVDKNIEIQGATVADGVIAANAPTVTSGSASMTASGFTAASSSDYYVSLTTSSGSAKSNAGVTTAGWVETTDTKQSGSTAVSVTGNGSKLYIPVSSGASETSVTPGTTDTVITVGAGYLPSDAKITVKAASSGAEATFTAGDTTVSSNVATMGTYSNTSGYVAASANRLATATFANTASSGTTYVDVSDATIGSSSGSAVIPVIPSGGYLYINKGYVDNLKVSLAHLVPDVADIPASETSPYILSGKTAYDKDGALITGSIATKTSSDLTVSGATVKVPVGYYAAEASKSVATATVSPSATASATVSSITATYNSTNKNYDITGSASISGTASAGLSGAGYVASAGTGSVSGTASVKTTLSAAALTHSNSATETKVAVSVSGAATGVTTASSGSYYVTVTGTQTAAGSVTHAASVSEGYVPTDGLSGNATIATSANITGSGTKVYLATTTVSDSMTSITASSGYTAPSLVTTAPSAPYIDILSTASTTANKVVTNSSATSHAYIPIFAGGYTVG